MKRYLNRRPEEFNSLPFVHHLVELVLRIRAVTRPHPGPALFLVPNAKEHVRANRLVDCDALAHVFAPVRAGVPDPRAGNRGVRVGRVEELFVLDLQALGDVRGRGRVHVRVVIKPPLRHLNRRVRTRVIANRAVTRAVVPLAEEKGLALCLVETVPLARPLAPGASWVVVWKLKVVVPRLVAGEFGPGVLNSGDGLAGHRRGGAVGDGVAVIGQIDVLQLHARGQAFTHCGIVRALRVHVHAVVRGDVHAVGLGDDV
mmetsp:Transcript_9768/g.36251  ORF Transcript_9768/g.36251 Transcript_9768/m.36251 type:complete len:258 (-) Transcript_9768:1552-2325(-)